MKIAVLFDGGGLARLGLELAGHDCTGYELDPKKHYLSKFVGSGNCILADATQVNLDEYDAVWASPPCQGRSIACSSEVIYGTYKKDYLEWCLELPHKVLWVENVVTPYATWGRFYNAAQFLKEPIQCRNRMIGGRYELPKVYRRYSRTWPGIVNAITASEYKGGRRRAYSSYGRVLSIEECAYHQGFKVPIEWYGPMNGIGKWAWKVNLYEAIGNGVPVYMAKAFGEAYGKS